MRAGKKKRVLGSFLYFSFVFVGSTCSQVLKMEFLSRVIHEIQPGNSWSHIRSCVFQRNIVYMQRLALTFSLQQNSGSKSILNLVLPSRRAQNFKNKFLRYSFSFFWWIELLITITHVSRRQKGHNYILLNVFLFFSICVYCLVKRLICILNHVLNYWHAV